MAQTTGSMSWVDAYVAYSLNGSAWVDVSGYSNSVEVSGGDRGIGETFTADGDTPIITAGKRGGLRVTAQSVFTQNDSDAWDAFDTTYTADGGGAFYLRWAPKGSDSGNQQFTTAAGEIESLSYPQGASDSPDALMFSVTVACASITPAVI